MKGKGFTMKKTLSVILATVMVLLSVAVFSSCDNDPVIPTEGTSEAAETEKETTTENGEDVQFSEIPVTAEPWYDEEAPAVNTEKPTDSDYQKEYDQLTLPPATTNSAEGNENDPSASVPQFTTPSTGGTTKKTDKTETTKKTSTNKETTTKTATTSPDSGDGSGVVTPSEVTRPAVTYFDKYVKSVLNSGNYTATVNGTFRGHSATVNIYKNGGTAYKITSKSFPVFRYFYSGGNVYIIVPADRSYAVVDVADTVVGMLESIVASESVAMTADGMTYCGLKSGVGYICETYKASDGTVYRYYFNDGGLTRIDVSGPSGNSTIGVSLRSGVSEGGVFSVPSGYRQVDVQEYIDKVESL